MNRDTDSLITAAAIAVQSQYYNEFWDHPNNPAASSYGPAQLGKDEYEPGTDPLSIEVAIDGMEKRISDSQSLCSGCDSTDNLIIAAMAQNGPGGIFDPRDVIRENGRIDWETMFASRNPKTGWTGLREGLAGGLQYDSRLMLRLFLNDLRALMLKGWKLPPEYRNVDWKRLENLASPPSNVNQPQ